MKKIYSMMILLPVLLSLASCEKFLDEKPQTDLTKPSTGVTELKSSYTCVEDAEAELKGAYALFKADIYEMDNFLVGDVMTDNCYVGGDGVSEEQFDNIKLTATNKQVAVMWSQYYALAGSATTVIENVRLMPEDLISPEDRARITSEAKFIRAWAYFDIVRLWGDAPMTLELIPSITAENLDKWYPVMYPERTPAAEIYKQILSDLSDDEIKNLESVSHGVFKATKGAAHGLRAKVFATMGAKSERDYNVVVDECDKVLAEGYGLVDNYDDLWTVDGKFSKESIFELYFTNEAEQHNWAYWVLLSEVSGKIEVTWRRYCTPTHDLVNKFDKENDARYASSIVWAKVPYDVYWPAENYPLAYKVRQKDNDIILMRLADILLLKAEALVELGQVEEAMKIVNQIRTRAGVTALDENITKEKAGLMVENERQLELLLEGHRWFDLVRNGRLQEVMKQAHDKKGNLVFTEIEDFRLLFPIPQGEIDKNERLVQNVGY